MMLTKMTHKQILWGMIILYIAVFGTITALRHYNFQTQAWDLAAFDQSFWNAAHGRGLVNNLEQVRNHLGLHFSPGLFLLVPGYVVFPSPYYLLIIQTIALALGAWPLFLLAKKVLGQMSRWPIIFAAAYLLYPSLHWANMYDFHEITFFIPLMLAALYFLEEQKWGWMAVFLALAASLKEDAILAVLFVGVYLILRRQNHTETSRQWKVGLAVTLVSLVYFVLAVKVLMPALGGGVLRLDRYANLGANPTEVIKNIAIHPALLANTVFSGPKLLYLLWLFLPVGFLCWFAWPSLVLLLPGLPENLLTNYQFQFSGLYHYDSILIPAIFVGVIFGWKKILTRWPNREKAFGWAFISLAAIGFLFRSPIGPASFPTDYFRDSDQKTAYRNLIRLVPEGVSVAANTNLVPHLTHREFVYALGSETFLTDFVIIDAADSFGFKNQEEFQTYLDGYLNTGFYRVQAFDDRYIVVMKNQFKLVPETKQ